MDLASSSNAAYNAMRSLVLSNAEIMRNIIFSIVTGIISSIIVTQIYRWKDAKREKIVFLRELYLFSSEASTQIITSLLQAEKTMTLEQVRDFIDKCPIYYSWIKFKRDEIKIVKAVHNESRSILIDIATVSVYEQYSRSAEFVPSDREKYKKDAERLEESFERRIKSLIKNNDKLREILEKYEKFTILDKK